MFCIFLNVRMENSAENGGYPELSSISALSETAALLLSTKQRPDSSSVVNAAALLAPFITTTTGEGGEGHTEESGVSRKMSSSGGSGHLSALVRQDRGLRVYALSMNALELVKKKDAVLADELGGRLTFEKDVLLVDTPPIDKVVHIAEEKAMARQQLEAAKEVGSSILHRPPYLTPLMVGSTSPLSQFPHQGYGMYCSQSSEDSRLPIGWDTPGRKGGCEINQSSHNGYAFRDMLGRLKYEEAMGDIVDEEEATQRAAIALALVKHSPVGKGGIGFEMNAQKKKRKCRPSSQRKNAT